jgi:hypothetical protein
MNRVRKPAISIKESETPQSSSTTTINSHENHHRPEPANPTPLPAVGTIHMTTQTHPTNPYGIPATPVRDVPRHYR